MSEAIFNSELQLINSNKSIPNRSVLAALTNKQSNEDGSLTEQEIRWLERRAKEGFGVITTAAAYVHHSGKSWAGELGVHSDAMLPGLENLATRINSHGAISLVQIFHGGMRAPTEITGLTPISSSRNQTKQSSTNYSRELSENEVMQAIQWFVDAAVRCHDAGFDGIEVHGAHGYLITQFLGRKTNKRTDNWGGTLQNRSRFLIEIIRGIRRETPKDFVIAVRISPEYPSCGITIDESIEVSKHLIDEGIDILHLSCWDIMNNTNFGDKKLPITEVFSRELGNRIPLITTGSIWERSDVEEAFRQGADLIGVGRAGIAHPDWPRRVHTTGNSRPPFTEAHLLEADLSPKFVDYMRLWDGFVHG